MTFLDPGPQCNRWLTLLEGQANLDELLEPLEPAESDAKEVEEISYLVGKTYDSRQVFEIEELGETIPYVSVRVGQASYSFSEMGLGELALNILHWQLSHAPRRSVVLIEEPETFVSPRSQRCLVDVICRYAVEREFFPIITTHSLGVAGRLPREKVVLVHGFSAGSPDIGVLQPPRDDQLNDVLGVPRRRTGLLLVEDTAAKLFAAAILDRVDPSLFGSFEFCHAGDATQIRQILECFPQTSIVTLVGLYDAGYDAQHSEPHWGYSFLPGDNPPERELRNALDAHPEIAAGALGRTVEELHAAAAALAGEDDHDWLTGLAERLGKSDEQLVDGLADAWLAAEANYDAAVALAGNVRALL